MHSENVSLARGLTGIPIDGHSGEHYVVLQSHLSETSARSGCRRRQGREWPSPE